MLLTDLFWRSVDRYPERLALDVPAGSGRVARQTVTYRQLAVMTAGLAERLAPHVRGECVIAVLLPRHSPWLIAAQLGVLRAGAAHVCQDVDFPDPHLLHVVRDVGAVAVITDAAGAERLAASGVPVLLVPERLPPGDALLPAPARSPAWSSETSLAYVIYTSGTTGLPKGVLLEHRGAVNLIREGIARFGIAPGDRIAQGSSPAYDSSVEEIWMALAAGATVVVLDDETVRLGPDLVPWLRRERISVLCPPPTLLRALGCRSPREELPALRLCYVGGEPLSEDLAELWGGALWLENGYGPTECTVTVVRGRVRAGEPVTIGTPVPPHVAHVLDASLRPVAIGEPGELCIAGPGLARGYLGHDELTAQRFVSLPGIGRVYRTGDLVVADAGGTLRCLGRIDAQVKVRGYRIELEAVEAALARCPGVREVVCTAQGVEPDRELVAHVVAVAAHAPPSFEALAQALRAQLPAYMVPTRFAALARVPRTTGGKVDRKALPWIGAVAAPQVDAANEGAIEDRVRRGFAASLGVPVAAVGDEDDFFALGGNSLRAALLISRFREDQALRRVAVRDLYAAPTVAGLSRRLRSLPEAAVSETAERAEAEASAARVSWFTCVQLSFLVALLLGTGAFGYVLGFVLLPWLLDSMSLPALLLLGPWLALVPAALGAAALWWLAVLAKELLIGRYEPARVSAFGGLRLRHWLVTSLVRLLPWSWIEGTELQSVVLRSLGARVGKRVHIGRGVDLSGGGWDLLELGDDVTLARDVDLGLCELDDGQLIVGAVCIGRGATLQARAGVGPDVVVGEGAVIAPLSFVASGTTVPAVSPMPRAGARVEVGSPWRYTWLVLAVRAFGRPLALFPAAVLAWLATAWFGVDGASLARWLCRDGPASTPWLAAWALGLAVAAPPLGLLASALLLRWTPHVPAGTHARWSPCHAWLTSRTAQLERAGLWLSGTLFWPWWLRLAGMRVGADVEVSTILEVLPEHVAIGSGSFLADGVYLGVPQVHQGRVTVAATALGERTFVGNHVVVAAGQQLPDDLLVGISTVADAATMEAGSSWFGQPPFRLPQREVVEVDRALTHEPGPLRYGNRLFWEGLRFTLPALPAALVLVWFEGVAAAAADGPIAAMLAAVAAALFGAVALAATVLVTKWLLLGRVRPGQHGLWSCWASRWDFHYVMWQRYGRALLQPLEGTLLLPWYLRGMGMRIGRRCVLGSGFAQVVDPDMITIEDGATVHALFQAHSFEDRVLKIDRVRLGRCCTVGRATVVLYGADIGDRAHVAPHSVVMKREVLSPGRHYVGAPTVESWREGDSRTGLPAAALRARPGAAEGRIAALDAARGLAVLGMVWLHFVPEPAEEAAGWGAAIVRTSLVWLEGLPAALFVLLAGVSWTLREHSWRYVLRRSAALLAIGLPFWRLCWPNDVLMPLACMLPLTVATARRGRGAIVAAIVLLLCCVPAATSWGAPFVLSDLLDDGTHIANHAWGAATWRYFVFDGAYPLLPWLCLPLLGALLPVKAPAAVAARWFWLALVLPVLGFLATEVAVADLELGDLQPHLLATWQPTSVPFLLLRSGAAVAIVVGMSWWSRARGLPQWLARIAEIGRMSLTHYLAHLCLVYVGLRCWWPDEDWSVAAGVTAAVGYAVAAAFVSRWWLRRRARGPIEALLRAASGQDRRDS